MPCPQPTAHPPSPASAAQATCVLAGSDFLESLKGISFKTAAGFVGRRRSLTGALQSIKHEKRWQLTCTQVSGVF